jgi:hypothetical protein
MRVSTFPTLYGERAVVRLFAGAQRYQRLDDLGMPDDVVRVEIRWDSKKLANPECPRVYKEVFMKELEPTQHCDIHTHFRKTSERRRRLRN